MDTQTSTGFSLSGVLQAVTATGLGYLDRRLDVDLERRMTRATTPTVQPGVTINAPNQLLSGSIVPLLLVGVVVLLVATR